VVNGLDLTRMVSPGALASQLLCDFGLPAPLSCDGLDDREIDAWCRTLHGGWVEATPTDALVPAVDIDGRAFYPTIAHAFGWWRL
jgi:hypothetical protein